MRRVVVFAAILLLGFSANVRGQDDETCTIEHCDDCQDPAVTCATCNDGTVKKSDGSACYTCPNNCEDTGCALNSAGAGPTCTDCITRYYEESDKCQECPTRCDMCAKADSTDMVAECSQAQEKYRTVDNNIYTCEDCSPNCIECVNEMECNACNGAYYLSGGLCYKCMTSCLGCTSGTNCDPCADHMFFDGTSCKSCGDHCSECSSATACTVCMGGFWLSGSGECISSDNCEVSVEVDGCTECEPDYRIHNDMTCQKCADLGPDSPNLCDRCYTSVQARFFDLATSQCGYCSENCMGCTAADQCSKCVDGMVWDDSLSTPACTSCATAVKNSEPECTVCDSFYWDSVSTTCTPCPDASTILASGDSCNECEASDKGNFWAGDGTCKAAACQADPAASQPTDSVECEACDNRAWNTDTNTCVDAKCEDDADTITVENECSACNNRTWMVDQCIESSCNGDITDNEELCYSCNDHMWKDETCVAIDCSSAGQMNEEMCESCSAWYYDTTSQKCKACDATKLVDLDSEDKCASCAGVLDVYYNGLTCQSAAGFDCTSANTKSKCLSCDDKFWNNGTASCDDIDSTLCSGSMDSMDKCTFCKKYYDGQCKPVFCPSNSSAVPSTADCNKCPGYYANGAGACAQLDCTDTSLPEAQCNQCKKNNAYWTESCQAFVACTSPSSVAIEGACMACPDFFWKPAHCLGVNCDDPAMISDETQCNTCAMATYTTSCVVLQCDVALTVMDTMDYCKKCNNLWEDGQCRAMVNCTTDIIHSAERCEMCSYNADSSNRMWFDNSTGYCYACNHENCLECDEDMCLTCVDGMYWDSDNLECLSCNVTDAAGSVIVNPQIGKSSECGICKWVTWEDNLCQYCPDNCKVCSSTDSCDWCTEGLVWDSYHMKCYDCIYTDVYDSSDPDTHNECYSCSSATQGRYLSDDNTQCLYCSADCLKCNTDADGALQCSECAANFYLDENECKACVTTLTPAVDTWCQVCKSAGFYWTNDVCSACGTDCISCTSADDCTACNAANKYWDSGNGQCSSCPVSGCEMCTSATDCLSCGSVKYFDGTTCTPCPAHCSNCEINGCQACDAGYFLSSGICKNCPNNCDMCSSETTCDACKSNFCLNQDAAGEPCITSANNCNKCQEVSLFGTQCLDCPDPYFLQVCEACDDGNCLTCDDNTAVCTMCEDGYAVGNNQCDPCADASCVLCPDDKDTCQTCLYNHGVVNGICKVCSDSACIACDGDETTCSECPALYAPAAGTCTACSSFDSKCVSCSSSACQTCQPLYYYDGSGCTACSSFDPQCAECNADGCSACKASNSLIGSACVACPANCEDCTATDTCTKCNYGYFLDGGSCSLCSSGVSNCWHCEDTASCLLCNYGYFQLNEQIQDATCLSCPIANCQSCLDEHPFCETCVANYTQVTTEKKECALSCLSCSGTGCDTVPVNVNASASTVCPGLGSGYRCLVKKVITGSAENVTRYCGASTDCQNSPDDAPVCVKNADGSVETCTNCCSGHLCNDGSAEPEAGGSNGAVIAAVIIVILIIAVVVFALVYVFVIKKKD